MSFTMHATALINALTAENVGQVHTNGRNTILVPREPVRALTRAASKAHVFRLRTALLQRLTGVEINYLYNKELTIIPNVIY